MTTPLGPGPEFDRIRAIAETLGSAGSGLGDDCALLPAGGRTLAVSVDASVEGVHFRREWLADDEIGWRAAVGALSDLAAVGAEAAGVLAALSLPRDAGPSLAAAIMAGVGAAATEAGTAVLGGDLTGGPVLAITVTVLGWAERPVLRRGARPGDGVWVTGTLGGARTALQAWRAGRAPPPGARIRFARPVARLASGRWLARAGATAMIDLSDGLAGDAGHLAAAGGVGLEIELERLPLDPALAAGPDDPRVIAALGGEDYELLATLPAGAGPACEPGPPDPLTRIGRVTDSPGLRLTLDGAPISLTGFDHFA